MTTQAEQLAQLQQSNAALLLKTTELQSFYTAEVERIRSETAQAIATAPLNWRNVHVDALTGDDETGLGTEDAPYETIPKAIESIPACGGGYVYLSKSQTYHITTDINHSTKHIYIKTKGLSVASEKAEIVFHVYTKDVYNSAYGFRGYNGAGKVIAEDVSIRVDETLIDTNKTASIQFCIFQSAVQATGSSLHLLGCPVDLGANACPLVETHAGIAHISLASCDFSGGPGRIISLGDTGTAILSVNSCSKTADQLWHNDAARVTSNV